MRRLPFLLRLAFVCNVFFLLALSLQFSRWFRNQDLEATVLIIGYFLAFVCNPLALALSAWVAVRRRFLPVPTWLVAANGVFFLLQIVFIFHLNAQ